MPLIQSSSEEALRKNIATEISAGKEPGQAAAIAYSVQRANDEAEMSIPAKISLAEINEANKKYWGIC